MNNLAATYRALGRHEDALAMQERALEFLRRVRPPRHPDIAIYLHNMSSSYERAGVMQRAIECAREALMMLQAALPPSHPHLKLAEKQVQHLESFAQGRL
jgi:tetratricopeptide (TPR) repeat protein